MAIDTITIIQYAIVYVSRLGLVLGAWLLVCLCVVFACFFGRGGMTGGWWLADLSTKYLKTAILLRQISSMRLIGALKSCASIAQ